MLNKLLIALALAAIPAAAQYFPPSSGGGGSGCTPPSVTFLLQGNGSGGCASSGITGANVIQNGGALGTPASGGMRNMTLYGATLAATFSCQILDNAICTSSVDASGNPNFLATAAGVSLPINGGSTPLVMFINGVYQNLNTNVNLTVPSTSGVQQWILALQDTTYANMVAADFEAMNTAPYYQYAAPTCPSPSPALSSTNPSFWYDLSTNLSKLCTANAGSYAAVASIVIGTVYVDATPKVLNVLTEPYRLNPYTRYSRFGNGSDGVLTITSGTTTIDTFKQYQSVLITGGALTHTSFTSNVGTVGVAFYSQNPVMVIVSATITANSLGRTVTNGGTSTGTAGTGGGFGGSGGGGGGSGTVAANGAAGGGHYGWFTPASVQGGSAGSSTGPTAGGSGTATAVLPLLVDFVQFCYGGSGASGGGDGTANGGTGGQSGGSVFMRIPSILAGSGATITATGANGGAGGGSGNAAGGGGGGGGCIIMNAGFFSVSAATVTVAGGGAGSAKGAGANGGTGGAGLLQENKLW